LRAADPWSAIAMMWTIPVPESLAASGCVVGVGHRSCVHVVLETFAPSGRCIADRAGAVCVELLLRSFQQFGPRDLLKLGIAVFVVAWIGQFIGHMLEGRRPSFFTDLAYLLVGPAWLMDKLLRRMGFKETA
jgi:hypothetical protein